MAQESAAPAPAAPKPYVPDETILPEFTFRAVSFWECVFGIVFGAVTVYVGLRAGLTVAASIPISVLSISLLRALGRATILENNIVQTTGSAGESVAGGVIFTLPALVFLGFPLEYTRIFLLALVGGWLGVLFMIPLRRQLIVKEHANLLYPEGTACADVLVAGEKGGSFASRVFYGLGLGGIYTLFQNENALAVLKPDPDVQPALAARRVAARGDDVGVPRRRLHHRPEDRRGDLRRRRLLMARHDAGDQVLRQPGPEPDLPEPHADRARCRRRTCGDFYIRYIGAGAVAAAGLITLMKTLPTIVAALTAGAADLRKKSDAAPARSGRTQSHDLPMTIVLGGALVIVAMMWVLLTLMPVPGAPTGALANLLAAVLVVIFGFLFVTVSSRIVGLIGTSSNPISGMAIATLMATCGVFLALDWTKPAYGALALMIGGTVCIAAANAGNTSQDLKTGFLVGATPSAQQLALFLGVATSSVVIGLVLIMRQLRSREIRTERHSDRHEPPAGGRGGREHGVRA